METICLQSPNKVLNILWISIFSDTIPLWYDFTCINLKICRKIRIELWSVDRVWYLNLIISHNAAQLKKQHEYSIKWYIDFGLSNKNSPISYDQPPPMVQTQIDLQQGCLIKVYNLGWFFVKTNDNKLQRSWDKKKIWMLCVLVITVSEFNMKHEYSTWHN